MFWQTMGPLPEAGCSVNCTGDATQICGDSQRISIFSLDGATPAVKPKPSSLSTYGTFSYEGCFNEVPGRALTGPFSFTNSLTVEMCVDFCTSKGYSVAGVELYVTISLVCFYDANYKSAVRPNAIVATSLLSAPIKLWMDSATLLVAAIKWSSVAAMASSMSTLSIPPSFFPQTAAAAAQLPHLLLLPAPSLCRPPPHPLPHRQPHTQLRLVLCLAQARISRLLLPMVKPLSSSVSKIVLVATLQAKLHLCLLWKPVSQLAPPPQDVSTSPGFLGQALVYSLVT